MNEVEVAITVVFDEHCMKLAVCKFDLETADYTTELLPIADDDVDRLYSEIGMYLDLKSREEADNVPQETVQTVHLKEIKAVKIKMQRKLCPVRQDCSCDVRKECPLV